MKTDHLSQLTKAQLIDALEEALEEISALEERPKWEGLDAEAKAFHHCVKALDALKPDRNSGYMALQRGGDGYWQIAAVLTYLARRYDIPDRTAALEAELEDTRAQLHQARDELGRIRNAIAPEHHDAYGVIR